MKRNGTNNIKPLYQNNMAHKIFITIDCALGEELRRVILSLKDSRISHRQIVTEYRYYLDLQPPGGTLPRKDSSFVCYYEEKPLFQGKTPEFSFPKWIHENLEDIRIVDGDDVVCFEGHFLLDFTVEETGYVTDVKLKGVINPLLEVEAARIISSSPQWTPKKICGNPVKKSYGFLMNFDHN